MRHWLRTPLRSLLVVLGITLGIALYVATEAAAGSMTAAFGEFVARVSGRADLTIEAGGPGVPGELLSSVADTKGVAHAACSVELTAQAPELHTSLLVMGVDFLGDLHFLPFAVQEGDRTVIQDPLAFVNDPTALLVSRSFATRHHLGQGGRVQLLTTDGPKDFFIRGVLEDSGAAASFGGQVAVMFIDAAQVSFARGMFVDRIDVAGAPGADLDDLQARLQKLVGGGVRVERSARLGTRLRSLSEPLAAALWVSGFLALLVGGFLVYNAVGVAVAQRRREVGVLRALGVTRRGTVALFCAEAALLALPGTFLGLLLGQRLSIYSTATTLDALDRLYASVPQAVPHLTPVLILQSIATGLLMAVLAAYLPARRAASVDPAIVIRGAASVEATAPPARRLLVIGLSLMLLAWLPVMRGSRFGGALAITLTVLGAAFSTPAAVIGLRALLVRPVEALLGVPGRLGLDYVQRTLGRSTVNVLALMVAVGMSVSVGGWLASLERSITSWAAQVGVADLAVTQGSMVMDRRHVPFSAAAAERVEHVRGIAGIERFRMVDQQVKGTTFRLVATDTDTFMREAELRGGGWRVVEGEPLRKGDLSTHPSIVLSENAARLLHVKVGQSITLTSPKGEVAFPVRAVIVDYTSESGAGFIDRRHYAELWGDDVVDGIFAFVAKGADIDAAAEAIQVELGGHGAVSTVFVTKTQALQQHIVQTLRQTFSYSRAVEIMTLLIALMGVVGTMAAAVIDRKREINMLRAIGATPGQVARAIIVEAGFLGFCAAVAGIAVGMIECQIFLGTLLAAQTGWHLDFVLPVAAAARTGALVVATSALAGAFPAWRAVRSEIGATSVDE
ncbi:MAG TPA: ABC transporter permease [Polyangiales bacterium]